MDSKLKEVLRSLEYEAAKNDHMDNEYDLQDARETVEEYIQSLLPQWIKVSDRLPDMNTFVLVVHKIDFRLTGNKVCRMMRRIDTRFTDDRQWEDMHGANPPHPVTHWQPLPTLP